MAWHPNDLVGDQDLADYEPEVLTRFGQQSWQPRRTKALEDWLFPILKGQQFDPFQLRTRYVPEHVWGYTASAYTDRTAVASDDTVDDLNLATLFATVGTDALYVGSDRPFRGLFFRLLDSVSAVASVMTVAYWDGHWQTMPIQDGTAQTTGKTFSGGGSVTWTLPTDWAVRKVSTAGPHYWVKVTVSATPTSATCSQMSCIRVSALRAPATLRTLALIFREAPTGADGPWLAKAEYYEKEADAALQRALAIVGGEFDTDADDVVSATEAEQTSAEAGGGWRLERA